MTNFTAPILSLQVDKALKRKIAVIFAVVVLSGLILALLLINKAGLRHYLETSSRVDANILVIEGWLPDHAIEMAYSEIHNKTYELIVPTGIKSSELDFCMVAMNGYLIFYPGPYINKNDESLQHKIEIVAHSKMGGKYNAHFNLYVNDSLVADFSADEKPRKYAITWNKSLGEIDSVSAQFTNDFVDDGGDRNLYIKEIIIDNNIIIPYQFNSIFDIGMLGGHDRILNNYTSHPEIIRNKLIAAGIDSSRIITVTGRKTVVNRTLTGAIAFRDWLKTSGYKVEGVNILTMGIHARRTWLTYKNVLDKSCRVGIIALPDTSRLYQKKTGLLGTLAEALDLIYYQVILLPY